MRYCGLLKRLIGYNERKYRFVNEINYNQLLEIARNNYVIMIDIRSKGEYDDGHLKGAINIPLSKITSNIINVANENDIIIVYCRSGIRSKKAANILKNIGYNNVYSLKNGIEGIG